MGINLTAHIAISTLGLLLFFTSSGDCIRCWVCNSDIDPKCADPFDNITILVKTCDYATTPSGFPKATMCRKIRQKVNGELQVSRSCHQDGDRDNDPCSTSQLSSYENVEHCSTCFTDLCNSAPALFQITSAVVGPVIVFLTKINIL